jgi:hypothetical protein
MTTSFFLDEDVHRQMPDILRATFPFLTFVSTNDLGTSGLDDIDLYPVVAAEGCDVFVTADIAQLKKPTNLDERIACRGAGLHWFGFPLTGRGLHAIAGQSACVIHAIPFIVDFIADINVPHWFLANGPLRQIGQVMARGPL